MAYHCYADDAQIYQVIKPLDNWDDISDGLEACLFDIKSWMCMNMLKLNQDKTELIVLLSYNLISMELYLVNRPVFEI